MQVKAIKTDKIIPGSDLFKTLDNYIDSMPENSILAITSKIVSICEGRVIKTGDVDKDKLTIEESDFYIPKKHNKYNMFLSIKNGLLTVSAGIDESNTNGYYVLWPKDAQGTANKVREYLTKKFNIKNLGIIITDSKTTPLRWGVTGSAIAYSGFLPIKDLIGEPDIFGRKLKVTKIAYLDALAIAAVFEMGEGNNQTPLAVITDIPQIEFQNRNPSEKELSELRIDLDDDIYAPLLTSVKWEKGGN